jgi:hypothetical protein
MKYLFSLFLLLFLASVVAYSSLWDELKTGQDYVLRLKNGDIITGEVVSFIEDKEEGKGIKFETEFGIATIYFYQIAEAKAIESYYRQKHKYFLLPTAIGIGNDHFVGAMELFVFYWGFGITDYFSIIYGRSLLPTLYSNQQLTLLNVKGSLPPLVLDDVVREIHFAFGGNLAFANHNNRFVHLYGVGTALFYKTSLSVSLFYKMGSGDIYLVRFANTVQDVIYQDGSFGISAGFDTKLPNFRDVHVIGELWNIDIAKPTKTGVFLGIRFTNDKFSSDFGFAFFTQPFFAPFVNFVWNPF